MLLVWVHDKTQSLLIVIVMRASLVASQFVFVAPFEFTGAGAVVYILAWAALLWGIALALTTNHRGKPK